MNETTTPVAAQSPGDLFEPPAIEWLGSWDELTATSSFIDGFSVPVLS
jgi:hypothetical protein